MVTTDWITGGSSTGLTVTVTVPDTPDGVRTSIEVVPSRVDETAGTPPKVTIAPVELGTLVAVGYAAVMWKRVRAEGDGALRDLTRRFDGCDLATARVEQDEIAVLQGWDLAERVALAMFRLLEVRPRHQALVVWLAHLLQRPAHTNVAHEAARRLWNPVVRGEDKLGHAESPFAPCLECLYLPMRQE